MSAIRIVPYPLYDAQPRLCDNEDATLLCTRRQRERFFGQTTLGSSGIPVLAHWEIPGYRVASHVLKHVTQVVGRGAGGGCTVTYFYRQKLQSFDFCSRMWHRKASESSRRHLTLALGLLRAWDELSAGSGICHYRRL